MKIESELRYSTSPKIILETAVVKACEVTISLDTDGILQRLKEIEAKIRTTLASTGNSQPLSPKLVWGYLLNQMQQQKNLIAGYTYATKINEDKLVVKGETLVIMVQSQGEASGLNYYIKDIENIICARFYEITRVIIEVEQKNDILAQGIEQINNMFGDGVAKIK